MSVSVFTAAPCFLLQPKLIWSAVLFSNCWSFDFNATRFHKIFSKLLDVFVLLALFELLSLIINTDNSNWLIKDVYWIIGKVFIENRMV